MAQSFNLKNIRTLLTQGFTDGELRRLCYDKPEFRPVYDQLAQGMGKDRVIDNLIEHAERKELMETLLAVAKELNPARYEKHQPYYGVPIEPTTSSSVHGKPQKTISDSQPATTSEAGSTRSGGVNISDISGGEVKTGPIVTGTVSGDVIGGDKADGDKVGHDKIVINIEAPKAETSEGDTAEEPQNSSKGTRRWWIPIPIAVAIITLIGVIFTTVWNSGGDSDPTSVPIVSDFTYQVQVQAKNTGDNISNASVIIEVGGKAPLDGITDSTGLARIFVSSSHWGQPGRLIVEADGYIKHRQEIDITEGALPKDILLEPEP